MKKPFVLFCFLLVIALTGAAGPASASSFDWKTYESEHFLLYYMPGYEWQAQQTIYYLEQHRPGIARLTGNTHMGKTSIVLQDVGIDSNGWADNMRNQISIFTNSPGSTETLSNAQNWFHFVSGHELTHIGQLNTYSEAGAVLPILLGNYYSPNNHVPNWIVEGITVYYESSLNPYEGRLNDGYYDAIVASKARAGKFPSLLEANYDHAHYPLGQWYTYGSVFMRYLAETYGEEKITGFFRIHGQHPAGFIGSVSPSLGIEIAARKAFGKTFAQLYAEWEAAERLEHADWAIDGRLVRNEGQRGYFSDLTIYKGKLYYIHTRLLTPAPFAYSGKVEMVEYDPTTNSTRVLFPIPSLGSARIQIVNDTIYYLTTELRQGYANTEERGFGQTGLLCAYNLMTGKQTRLFSDDIEAFAVLQNGAVLYTKERKDAYGNEVWQWAGKASARVGTVDQMIGEILPYEDHFIVVSKVNMGSWNIQHFRTADLSFTPIADTPWKENEISLRGHTLFFTANYQRHYGLYSYDLLTGQTAKLTGGGYASGGSPLGDEIFFKAVTADGDAIFKKALLPTPYTPEASEQVNTASFTGFLTTLKEGSAPPANWKQLLIPYNRLFPTFLEFEDALGLTSCTVDYSSFGGLDVTLNTTELQPLKVSIGNYIVNPAKERVTDLALSYPLYRSNQFGLQSVDFAGYTDFAESIGSMGAAFRLPGRSLSLRAAHSTQGTSTADAAYTLNFAQSSLRFNGGLGYRWNHTPEENGLAYTLKADYTRKLLEVREGFWNSTIYLSDVYGNLHFGSSGTRPETISASIQLEASLGFQLPTIPEFGVTYSFTDRTSRPYFEFSLGF